MIQIVKKGRWGRLSVLKNWCYMGLFAISLIPLIYLHQYFRLPVLIIEITIGILFSSNVEQLSKLLKDSSLKNIQGGD